jgi:hypothetical protein
MGNEKIMSPFSGIGNPFDAAGKMCDAPVWSGRQRATQPDTMTGSTPGLEERYVISIVFRFQGMVFNESKNIQSAFQLKYVQV